MNPENSGLLEYQSLKQILARFTDSPLGAQLVDQLAPISQKVEIQKRFELTGECVELLKLHHSPPFREMVDPSLLFQKLSIEGVVLNPKEIQDIF